MEFRGVRGSKKCELEIGSGCPGGARKYEFEFGCGRPRTFQNVNLKLDVKLDLGVAGCLQNENLELAEGVQGPPKM